MGRLAMDLRPQRPIDHDLLAHFAQQPLQDLDRIAARIDVHVEHGCVQRAGSSAMRGRSK